MLNTCSIGRRWKPREGWSRPVLTGERGTLFPTRLLGRVSSCGGFFRWMARSIVSCGHDDDTGEAFCLRPLSGSRTATIGIVAWFRFCRPILVVGRCIGFAVVMAQVRRPVPFRTRKLRPGRGDGTALERGWESSTPPHSTYGPSGRAPSGFPGGLFFIPACGCFPPFGGGLWTPEGPWAGGSFRSPGVSGRWGIPGIPGELPALIRWWNRLGNHALFRTQTLRRIEQNHVSRQSDGPAGRRPELA